MKAVIVSSSYSYLERVELLKEHYDNAGYDTTVLFTDFIHAKKSYASWEKDGYVLLHTTAYKKNISISRLYSHYKFAKDVKTHLEQMEVDLLHVLLPANFLAKVAAYYKKEHPQVKLFFDVIDLWPETMPIHRFKKTYPFVYWRRLRDDHLDAADRVYCECELFTKVMQREKDPRFQTLYWVKGDKPLESHPNLCEDELQLCYLGSINNVIDIAYIAEMCTALARVKKVILHIIGDGEKREELLARLQETPAKVIYHGLLYEQEEKQAIFDQCHFGLNIMKSSVCVGLTMKSLDYFQAGLPIINNISGDTEDFISAYHIGFHGYQALLEKLPFLQEADYLAMREQVRTLYNEKFTKEAFQKRLEDEE